MTTMTFIIRLKRGYEAFMEEVRHAKKASYPEYFRFLNDLRFAGLVDRVITACAMYPRSVELCEENLIDLSHGMFNDCGLQVRRLGRSELDSLERLVISVGREVIMELAGHNYYLSQYQIPRECRDDPDYASDMTAISDVQLLNSFTFQVNVNEHHLADFLSEVEQNNTLPVRRSSTRSLQ